jgi:hypothetical protein
MGSQQVYSHRGADKTSPLSASYLGGRGYYAETLNLSIDRGGSGQGARIRRFWLNRSICHQVHESEIYESSSDFKGRIITFDGASPAPHIISLLNVRLFP